MILSVTETIPKTSGIEYIAFEVFSAFGTVGLTMGLTPDLTAIGKLIIIALMYIGRVGVLTVVFSDDKSTKNTIKIQISRRKCHDWIISSSDRNLVI